MLTLRVQHRNTVQSSTRTYSTNYSKEHNKCTRYQETKYNLQIHLYAIFLYIYFLTLFFFIQLLYLPIKDVSDVAQLCNCIHECLYIQWLKTENNQDTQWLASVDYRLTVPTTILLEFKVILYNIDQSQNTLWINFECRENKEREHMLLFNTKLRGVCLAIHSTMAMDIRLWTEQLWT